MGCGASTQQPPPATDAAPSKPSAPAAVKAVEAKAGPSDVTADEVRAPAEEAPGKAEEASAASVPAPEVAQVKVEEARRAAPVAEVAPVKVEEEAMAEGKSLVALPKAHLHLHLRQSGRQTRIKEFMSDFNVFVKEKTAKYELTAQAVLDAPEKLDTLEEQGLAEPEVEWIGAIKAAKKDYEKAVESLEAAEAEEDEGKKDKSKRKVKKTKQKYEALLGGLEWDSRAQIEDPLQIERAPMTFAGFTEITAMQQSIIGCHPKSEAFAFRQLLWDLCEDAAVEGIRWFEISISLEDRRDKWVGICRHIDEAAAEFPTVGVGIILCISRGDQVDSVDKALDTVIQMASEDDELIGLGLKSKIVAMGLVGNEVGDPLASKFEAQFDKAKALGWFPVPHAGEMTGDNGPAGILDALKQGAKRIGHGFLAMNDSDAGREAVSMLKECKVCCEVCPISNIHLCDKCFKNGDKPAKTFKFKDHPLPQMLAAGIPCCLNGDDPATFGAPNAHGLVREFEVCRSQMGLSDAQLAQCARDSFVHSFCPEAVKTKALQDIDKWEKDA